MPDICTRFKYILKQHLHIPDSSVRIFTEKTAQTFEQKECMESVLVHLLALTATSLVGRAAAVQQDGLSEVMMILSLGIRSWHRLEA